MIITIDNKDKATPAHFWPAISILDLKEKRPLSLEWVKNEWPMQEVELG